MSDQQKQLTCLCFRLTLPFDELTELNGEALAFHEYSEWHSMRQTDRSHDNESLISCEYPSSRLFRTMGRILSVQDIKGENSK